MLEFSNLGLSYRPGEWVLRGLQGVAQEGRTLAVLGPNGKGKTTLLKLLLGTLRPTEGHVSRPGEVAYVPQGFDAPFAYSVLDMVLMGRARQVRLLSQPGSEDLAACQGILEKLGIARLAKRNFLELSGGERQLVVLARALVGKPRVLLLDEPTAALDIAHQGMVVDWIRRLARADGLTVVFTTHNPQHALAAADDALLLYSAEHMALGPVSDLLTTENLSTLYRFPILRSKLRIEDRESDVVVPAF